MDTAQFKVIGYYTGSVDTEKDLTNQVTWSTSDADIVSVFNQPEDKKGFLACYGVGNATINVIVPGTIVQANLDVTVNPRP